MIINTMIYVISTIIFIALIIWAYNTPERKAYDDWYAKKLGYWDTVLCVSLLIIYNVVMYALFGKLGLLFPFSFVYDTMLIFAIITSILRVKRVRKKKNK